MLYKVRVSYYPTRDSVCLLDPFGNSGKKVWGYSRVIRSLWEDCTFLASVIANHK